MSVLERFDCIRNVFCIVCLSYLKIKNRDEMEKRTQTGLVMGHAYGVTAVKKVTVLDCVHTVVLTGMVHYMHSGF